MTRWLCQHGFVRTFTRSTDASDSSAFSQATRTSPVSNTDRYTSCSLAAAVMAVPATDSAETTCKATVSRRHRRHNCRRPLPEPATAADRSDCRAAVSTCPRPATGWPLQPPPPPPPLTREAEAVGPTVMTPASPTSRSDTARGSRRRNSTSWNGVSARLTIRTYSCARRSPCELDSPNPECR